MCLKRAFLFNALIRSRIVCNNFERKRDVCMENKEDLFSISLYVSVLILLFAVLLFGVSGCMKFMALIKTVSRCGSSVLFLTLQLLLFLIAQDKWQENFNLQRLICPSIIAQASLVEILIN